MKRYVLSFNSTHQDDLDRVNKLIEDKRIEGEVFDY